MSAVTAPAHKPGPAFYFDAFEHRVPEAPVPYSMRREILWQLLATMNLVFGGWYIGWRWTVLNTGALWFAVPLALAETAAYIGLLLFTFNLWKTDDPEQQAPPRFAGECGLGGAERPVAVDIFITTYNEDPELVRLSIRDAVAVRYPHPIELKVHVLDDGRRAIMRAVAEEEGAGYISRTSNIGFKAGNLRNAMEQTTGDFMVICDADTRLFPTLLEHTMGYFRDERVAWVQTPQWFYDIPQGVTLEAWLRARAGKLGAGMGRLVEKTFGEIRLGVDPFDNDPKIFYDFIQRRRNGANAAFCCGAGSIHRRDAVMEAALKSYGKTIDGKVSPFTSQVEDEESRGDLQFVMGRAMAEETELTPYKFHVSEDIYTSIVLHSDRERQWRSIYHPQAESKMLSPQDLQTWIVQRFKYAGGTLDIMAHDNPLFRRGSGLTLSQRLMYAATFWSYLGGLWNVIFLLAPIVYFFTSVAPVSGYSGTFLMHILPFLIMNELAFLVGTWGASSARGKASFISFFPLNLRAIWTVLRGKQIKFPTTPKERQNGRFVKLVIPQITVMTLTIAGVAWQGFLLANGTGNTGAFVINTFWGLNNVLALQRMVSSAFWQPAEEQP